ncbi:MAG TPA: MGMT family protein [Chthoniobacteraceae bacterium]
MNPTTSHTLKAGVLTAEITLHEGRLRSVTLPVEAPEDLDAAALAELSAQLAEFPIDFSDSPPFIRKVWQEMRQIPSGSAVTYTELAEAVGSPRAVRAVGQACATNPRLLIVPCHRVVGMSGLGGFRLGLDWKRKLLELEAAG